MNLLEYDDLEELQEFVENFCPFSILNHKTIDWFDAEMVEIYKELSKKLMIPKTWYALYKAIQKNPDSPMIGDRFYLKTKATRVFEQFVLPIGEIFKCIGEPVNRVKFTKGFQQLHDLFKSKLN